MSESLSITTERGAPPARPVRPRRSWSFVGLLPFFIFTGLFLGVPLGVPDHRQLPGPGGRGHPPELRRPVRRADPDGVPQQHRDQPRDRHRRRHPGLPARRRDHQWADAGRLRCGTPDLLGGRLQLRRRPARPRLHVHPRPARPGDELPQGLRCRHLGRRLQPLHEARPRDRLPLLPVPAHGPDHRACHQRPEAGVARGRREHGRDQPRSTGAASPCRSSCRPSSAA